MNARAIPVSTLVLLLLACAACTGASEQADAEPVVSEEPLVQSAASLSFTTSRVAEVTKCSALGRSDCADVDRDGLTDAWEDTVLAHFQPRLEFDEQERGLTDPRFRVGTAGRVVARRGDPSHVVVFYGFAFSEDYGSCSFTDHHGDVERAVIELERTAGTNGDVRMVKAFTAAHEGDVTDASHIYERERLASELELVSENGAPRWLLYTSRNKHGTYANKRTCESKKLPCVADYCASSNKPNRNDYRRLPLLLNAGEPDHPRDSDWSRFGYEGADAWSTKPFCGVASSGSCDSAPRSTFVRDPFTKTDI